MNNCALHVKFCALASELVKACGGLTSAALECDISETQLQRATDTYHPYTLKLSTIYHLEQACGEPIISRGLLSLNQTENFALTLRPIYIGIDYASAAAQLSVTIKDATKDGKISINEHKIINTNITRNHNLLGKLSLSCLPDTPISERPT